MSDALKKYETQLKELLLIRKIHLDKESDEEDKLLEEMDATWLEMTEDDHKYYSNDKK